MAEQCCDATLPWHAAESRMRHHTAVLKGLEDAFRELKQTPLEGTGHAWVTFKDSANANKFIKGPPALLSGTLPDSTMSLSLTSL